VWLAALTLLDTIGHADAGEVRAKLEASVAT
jgi:hypothetical protein